MISLMLPKGGQSSLPQVGYVGERDPCQVLGLSGSKANHGNMHLYFLDVTTLRRDPPGTPRDCLMIERYDSGSYPGPAIHLFWDNRNPHLDIRKGAPRFKFATLNRYAINKMVWPSQLSDLL